MEIPVYLFTGLLESGKTTLIHEVAGEEGFLEPGNTLLIRCEEGEEEFSEEFLRKYSMILLDVEEAEELNESFWRKSETDYKPAQIMIEYNGMWTMDTLFDSGIPGEWFMGGIYSTVNAQTAELYLSNMRGAFMEPLKESNLIIFNRCDENIDRVRFRRMLKALNPQVQIAFEKMDGSVFADDLDQVPYDFNQPTINIEGMDYGLWYVDAMEHPGRYIGKNIHFTAKFCASMKAEDKYFVPGRHIMTCCEADIEFYGYVCYFEGDMPFKHNDWVEVTVEYDYGMCDMYGEEGPILRLVDIKGCKAPENELVTFT